jgi:hypothetical protein
MAKYGRLYSIEQRRELYKLGHVIKYGSNITYKEAEALLLSLRKHKDD